VKPRKRDRNMMRVSNDRTSDTVPSLRRRRPFCCTADRGSTAPPVVSSNGLIFPQESARSAFTLIELLVVMSILAVLTALLVPVLRTARDSALAVHCLNNLRQLGIAFPMYAEDHNDRLPPGIIGSSYGDWSWFVSPYMGYTRSWHENADGTVDAARNRGTSEQFGNHYLRCPVEVGSYNGQFEILGNYGSVGSYGVNYSGTTGSRPFAYWPTDDGPRKEKGEEDSKKITAVASSEFLAADATLPYIYSPSWRSFKFDLDGDGVLDTSMITTGPDLYNKLEPRHSGSANMLFVDGSVRLIPLKDWLHGENYLW